MKQGKHTAIAETIRVLCLLSSKEYDKIGDITHNRNLLPRELAEVVDEYGCTITAPPKHAGDIMDITKVKTAKIPTWFIAAPVWTIEEGESDLFLEMTIEIHDSNTCIIIDGLHVL